jgi:hypothetical protein
MVFLAWLVPVLQEIGLGSLSDVWLKEILVGEPLEKGGFWRHFIEFPFHILQPIHRGLSSFCSCFEETVIRLYL